MVKIRDNLTLQKETLNCSEDKNLVIATEEPNLNLSPLSIVNEESVT